MLYQNYQYLYRICQRFSVVAYERQRIQFGVLVNSVSVKVKLDFGIQQGAIVCLSSQILMCF